MEQIIKFGISNYLQLCVEAGFSQIKIGISRSMPGFANQVTSNFTYDNYHSVQL